MVGWGVGAPRIVSGEQSKEPITLANLIREDHPLITLAVRAQRGGQDALPLHFNHQGVNSALMLAGVQAHASHDGGACLGSVLNQGRANSGADQGAEVHRWCGELRLSYRAQRGDPCPPCAT